MTQEEKAKAYDEALERARKIHDEIVNNEVIGFPGQITDIFPELRESEDERIRKELIKEFEAKLHKCFEWKEGIPNRRVLDWLEKQKEQDYEDEECTDFTIYHPLKNGKGKYECIPYSFYGSLSTFSEDKDLIDFLRTCFYTKEECNEWIENQKEQKPIKGGDIITKDTDRHHRVFMVLGTVDERNYNEDHSRYCESLLLGVDGNVCCDNTDLKGFRIANMEERAQFLHDFKCSVSVKQKPAWSEED